MPVRIYRSLDEVTGFGPSALTIGNFDGVHAGHRHILRCVVAAAAERGIKASAVTFHPHPLKIVAPERAPRLLTTPEERARIMGEAGIEQVLILPFTPELMHMPAEEFARQIIAGRLGARVVLVGENFRFGHQHAGDVHTLEACGSKYGFEVRPIPAIRVRGRLVSSSEVRKLVDRGQVALAYRLLERSFALEGPVVAGRGVGSKRTVPTLNLKATTEVLPAPGVYVTRTVATGRSWQSVTNVGFRPTFEDDRGITVETFVLEPFDAGTPPSIRVEFLTRLREERKFESPEALKEQILRDVSRAKKFFRLVQNSATDEHG